MGFLFCTTKFRAHKKKALHKKDLPPFAHFIFRKSFRSQLNSTPQIQAFFRDFIERMEKYGATQNSLLIPIDINIILRKPKKLNVRKWLHIKQPIFISIRG